MVVLCHAVHIYLLVEKQLWIYHFEQSTAKSHHHLILTWELVLHLRLYEIGMKHES